MEVKVNKVRNWFLTINEEADCFCSVVELLASYEKCEYSLILHDKDNEEQPHYHVCILFENARTFEQMQKKFKGAHIEIMESKYLSFRYLLHLDDKDKFQYDIKEVIQRGNNVEYYSEHDEYIKLDTESVLECISNGSITTIFDAVKVFGIKQTNLYRNIIKELLETKEIERRYVPYEEYDRVCNELSLTKQELLDSELTEYKRQVAILLNEKKSLEETNNNLLVLLRKYENQLKGGN